VNHANSGCKNEPATRVVSGSLLERGEGCHSPSGTGVTNRSSTVAVPRSSTAPDRKDGPRSDDSYSIAPLHEGNMLRVSRVCDALEVPMSHDNQSGILRLHSHRTLADSSTPAMKPGEPHSPAEIRMRERHALDTLGEKPEARFIVLHAHAEGKAAPPLLDSFITHLNDVCGLADATDAERARTALVRLGRERPELHAAVVLMSAPGATVRSVAPALGVSPKTVCLRHNKGLTMLRLWCQSDEAARANVG